MFGLDPFNPSIAIAEIVLLLELAALVGWLLGRLVLNGRIKALRTTIADREAELNNVRQSKTMVGPARTEPSVPVTSLTRSQIEPVMVTNATLVSTDSTKSIPPFSPENTAASEVPSMDVPGVDKPDIGVISRNDDQTDISKKVEESTPVTSSNTALEATDQDIMHHSKGGGQSLRQGMSMPGISMPGTSEAAVISRIAARAHEVNFDRIGRATAAEADDLKDIIGIGPFLERKLNAIGIYTYRQVANFTKEDAETVNRIIEFFPGRIERDNWVDQSQAFHERKYGARR